ncbi:hypothetical protein [Clostridium saccharoperbutylacetonicum]
MAFWTYHSDGESKEQTHEIDEYKVCVALDNSVLEFEKGEIYE